MSLFLSDRLTGWSFECLTDSAGKRPPEGGIVLRAVRHQQHNFARDLRLIGLRIVVQEVDAQGRVTDRDRTSRFFPLSTSFFKVGELQVLAPEKTLVPNPVTGSPFLYLRGSDDALLFKSFFVDPKRGDAAGYGVRAHYRMHDSVFAQWPNPEYKGLEIDQIFLFSPYAGVPPHEPTKSLTAARCHPMTKFSFSPNDGCDKRKAFQRIESIRFDYRLHLYIDRFDRVGDNSLANQLGNSAGLFRDNRSPNLVGGLGVADVVFDAIEKPLVLEVIAPGLTNGFAEYSSGKETVKCWDNVHWWGSRGAGKPIISAPGAFHAGHMHWRWGAENIPFFFVPEVHTSAAPPAVLAHPLVGAAAERSMVDPAIWMQSIRLAVVKNEPSLDPNQPDVALSSLSKDDWASLFDPGLKRGPADIYDGADLVLWLSIEVPREIVVAGVAWSPSRPVATPEATYRAGAAGTVFQHGLFFPHDPEQGGIFTGSTEPEHWPDDPDQIREAKKWFRPAG
jgi:hypothetical protein